MLEFPNLINHTLLISRVSQFVHPIKKEMKKKTYRTLSDGLVETVHHLIGLTSGRTKAIEPLVVLELFVEMLDRPFNLPPFVLERTEPVAD